MPTFKCCNRQSEASLLTITFLKTHQYQSIKRDRANVLIQENKRSRGGGRLYKTLLEESLNNTDMTMFQTCKTSVIIVEICKVRQEKSNMTQVLDQSLKFDILMP